jgi:flagellar FliL protein
MAQVHWCGVSMKAGINYGIALVSLVLALPALAAGGGAKMAEGVNYIPLESPLVVNYGGPGKARFIRVELSVRAENAADATEVLHHLPLIRDRLVSILSAQAEEVVSTAEGREYLRVYALAEINTALLTVAGHAVHEPDDKSSAGKKPGKEKQSEGKAVSAGADQASKLPTAADVKPVKGPATDLFFNNFVVQK